LEPDNVNPVPGCRYVLDNPQLMLGRRVLDVGSGSGACAIAAVKGGAQSVTANDTDPGIL
jgi:predicted nicotinamide N-methyase